MTAYVSVRRLALFAAAALLAGAGQAAAQGYFIPPQNSAPRAPAPSAPRPAPRPAAPVPQALPPPPPVQIPGGLTGVPGNDTVDAGDTAAAQLPNIPVPDLPPLPKGAPPPPAVIGVLGVPEIMRAATASQQVEKIIGERREKLNQDAQKEQAAWRDLQQQLGAQRATLTPDQVRQKERELQERITAAQASFRDRNRIIQETAQYSLSQIERTLIGVIRQVAESRGMNLVLHRTEIVLNSTEFDISDQVAEQLNKLMPTVDIPPDGSSPFAALAELQRQQQSQAQQAPAPSAPAPAPSAPTPPAPAPATTAAPRR